MQELLSIMHRLRAPNGCPWDREQTHESLRPYLLEEAAEAVDAIAAGNPAELCAELGDVLLQVAFHSTIAQEQGTFSYAQVEQGIVGKLIRRHPHVFAPQTLNTEQALNTQQAVDVQQVLSNWQAIKAAEQGSPRTLQQQIPSALGALAREQQAQKLLAQQGMTQQVLVDQPTALSVKGQPTELDIGALLAKVVALAAQHGLDAETALRRHTDMQLREGAK